MDTNEDTSTTPVTETIPPQRGTHQATVKESADLLKRLADFQSRKEEVLKKLSDIGERMQKRIDGLSNAEIIQEDVAKAKEKAGLVDATIVGTDHPEHNHYHFATAQRAAAMQPISKMAYTRFRETPKPVFVEGCFNIALPNKQALDEDWQSQAKKIGEHGLAAGFQMAEDHIDLEPGGKITIATGLKVCVPEGLAMWIESFPGLTVITPRFVTQFTKTAELSITVRNDTTDTLQLLHGVNLFTCHLAPLQASIHVDELLNSTYEDWVNGTITG